MTARDRAESTPVARDEVGEAVGEAGPMLRTADDLRQYEREGVRLDGSMGFAWWVDGDWITATDQYFSSKALIEDYGFVFVSFDPHLTPQPDGDVRRGLMRALCVKVPALSNGIAGHLADAVLASGLVVPVGEMEKAREAAEVAVRWQLGAKRKAEAQVAAVRRELERWDGYGHGEFNIHMPEHLPCSACNLMAAIRAEMDAALDAASASPTTDQREGADS